MARAESSFADLRSAQRFALEIGALDDAFGLIASIREFAMRAMRYEVFAWADAACRAPGALDHPLAPLLTGMRGLRRVGARRVRPRRVSWPRRPAGSKQALSVAAERSGRACARQRALHRRPQRRSGTSRRRVSSSSRRRRATTRGSCTRATWARWRSAPRAAYDEARAPRRRARASSAQKTGARPIWRRPRSPKGSRAEPRTRRSTRSSPPTGIARSAGNRWMSAFARTEASGLLVARGDVDEGCAGLAEMVALWYRAGDWSQQWHTLSRCVIALHRIGQRRARHGAGRSDRGPRDARRRADDVDPARRRVRARATRLIGELGEDAADGAAGGRRALSRSTTSSIARARALLAP